MTEQLFTRDGTPVEVAGFTSKGRPLGRHTCPRCGGGGMFGPVMVRGGVCFGCEGTGVAMVRIRTAKENAAMDRARDRARAKKQARFAVEGEIRKIRNLRRTVREGFWAIEKIHAKVTRTNAWIGEAGDRRDFEGSVRFVTSGEGRFGRWFLTVVDTAEGTVTWWNAFENVDKGSQIKFSATIKKHDERDGEKQTVVLRCKLAA